MIDSIQEFPSIADNVNIGREEAGKSTEEDEEILAYLEYKKSEDHKNGTNSITNSGSVGEVTKKDQLEPEDDDDK
ncbi:hypothetical protein RhiirA5_419733 [Rhizophagus irregularis]|uniref:Uncharacterized protein n=1 Tax=Rhizophagus irregularis TaxID=588596 RepID=A0A2N0PHR8_9GLOM|nr:hypothetical protein RhiirA5_419733 [Rhizophagus irregularis]